VRSVGAAACDVRSFCGMLASHVARVVVDPDFSFSALPGMPPRVILAEGPRELPSFAAILGGGPWPPMGPVALVPLG
jgi:hypothetical protein